MSSYHNDHTDDEDFDAFLRREGSLSNRLQQLPQPKPSIASSETIMAHVEKALHHRSPANDVFIQDAKVRSIFPGFKRLVRVPLALAATAIVAVMIGLLWQSQSPDPGPLVVAHAPQPTAAPSQVPGAPAEPAAIVSVPSEQRNPAIASKHVPAPVKVAPTVIAQADLDAARKSIVARPATSGILSASGIPAAPPEKIDSLPAATTAIRPDSDTIPAANADPKAWLAMIDEMIKADLKRDALDEWEKFRKAYPSYPVPDKLDVKIKALKK